MSDAIVLPEAGAAEPRRTPTVYFIDDSATMREVIKIAFRRESINVVTCADAASALAQFDENPPPTAQWRCRRMNWCGNHFNHRN